MNAREFANSVRSFRVNLAWIGVVAFAFELCDMA